MDNDARGFRGLRQHEPPFEIWAKPAAVMLNLCPGPQGDWAVLLTQRPKTLHEHGGQVAFPGGRFDRADTSLWAAAARETWEEVGIWPTPRQRIGFLEPLYIAASGYTVLPCVSLWGHVPGLRLSTAEVADAAWIPLGELARVERAGWHRGQWMWEYPLEWARVWGATAKMLGRLLRHRSMVVTGPLSEPFAQHVKG